MRDLRLVGVTDFGEPSPVAVGGRSPVLPSSTMPLLLPADFTEPVPDLDLSRTGVLGGEDREDMRERRGWGMGDAFREGSNSSELRLAGALWLDRLRERGDGGSLSLRSTATLKKLIFGSSLICFIPINFLLIFMIYD